MMRNGLGLFVLNDSIGLIVVCAVCTLNPLHGQHAAFVSCFIHFPGRPLNPQAQPGSLTRPVYVALDFESTGFNPYLDRAKGDLRVPTRLGRLQHVGRHECLTYP